MAKQPATPTLGGPRRAYEDVRDDFLGHPPKTQEQWLKYYVEIGKYVFDRWTAIASDHQPGAQIDETACEHRWNDCTEGEFKHNKTVAAQLIAAEAKRQGLKAIASAIDADGHQRRWLPWLGMTILEHVVGAIGFLIIAGLVALAIPSLLRLALEPVINATGFEGVAKKPQTEPTPAPIPAPTPSPIGAITGDGVPKLTNGHRRHRSLRPPPAVASGSGNPPAEARSLGDTAPFNLTVTTGGSANKPLGK